MVVVAIETVVPLLAAAGASAVLGFHQLVKFAFEQAVRVLNPSLMCGLAPGLLRAVRADPTTGPTEEASRPVTRTPSAFAGLRRCHGRLESTYAPKEDTGTRYIQPGVD